MLSLSLLFPSLFSTPMDDASLLFFFSLTGRTRRVARSRLDSATTCDVRYIVVRMNMQGYRADCITSTLNVLSLVIVTLLLYYTGIKITAPMRRRQEQPKIPLFDWQNFCHRDV